VIVRSRRLVPALVVLLVLFASQAAYAAEVFERPSGHCAAAAPPPDERCPLPLWLPCCEDQAAVGQLRVAAPEPAGPLVLAAEAALAQPCAAAGAPEVRRAAIPPDPPSRLSTVLLI
jgi:hypothetical protein